MRLLYVCVCCVLLTISFLVILPRQFFESPNFAGWFQYRQLEANQKLRLLHVELLCKAVSSRVHEYMCVCACVCMCVCVHVCACVCACMCVCVPAFVSCMPACMWAAGAVPFPFAVCQDINFWMRGKHELEVVDFLIRIKTCLVSAHPLNHCMLDPVTVATGGNWSHISPLQASCVVH